MDLKEGWAPLCAFLRKPVPDEPFPRANDAESADATAKRVVTKLLLMWAGAFTAFGGTVYIGFRLWNMRQH